ncbi:hypothetical protein [Massilia brevitalea]|uniref:hypothetical protein n=1 Tax=Massilia brevitalea TaxID=442526 RepID=UPI002738BE59|nr:hypothetical protein [Massilia brevitalea]
MSVSQGDSAAKSRFNYLLCIDLVALVSILVIAGRPEALAITVSAIIICVAALAYRATLGVKSYVANAAAKAKSARTASQQARRMPAATPAVPVKPGSRSWLRDSE